MTTMTTYEEFEQRIQELEQDLFNLRYGSAGQFGGEDEYRLMIENQNDLIVKLDPEFRLLFISPSYCELFGKETCDLIGKKFMPLIHQDDRDRVTLSLNGLFGEPYTCYHEERALTQFGWRWLAWSDKAVLDENGVVTAIIGIGRDITKRKLAEEALRVAEERYRVLVENTFEGIAVAQNDRFVFVNQKLSEISGYAKEELMSRNIFDFVYQEDSERVFINYKKRLRGGVVTPYTQFRILAKDGKRRWIQGSFIHIQWEGQAAELFFFTDIHGLKLTEEALRKSESRLTEAQRIAHVGIWDRDLVSGRMYWSDEHYRLLGYEPGAVDPSLELMNRHIHPNDMKMVLKLRNAAFKRGEVFDIEYRLIQKDEIIRTVNAIARVKTDKTGRPIRYYGTLQDITDRKLAEEAIQKSERRYRRSIESAPYGIMVHNKAGKILIFNSQLEKISGYTKEEIPDVESWIETLYWDEKYRRQIITERRKNPPITGRLRIKEHQITCKNGEKRVCLFSSILSPSGLRTIFVNDVTVKKEAEAALKRSRDELEHRVKERTEELEIKTISLEEVNTALRVLLRKRDDDKIELEDKVMHNVQELVLPYLEKLRDSKLSKTQRAFLDIIKSNIDDIISPFSRSLNAKYSHLTPAEIQIIHLLKQGKTTKEVAELINLSARTIETHRKNIRKKLGLYNTKVNLKTHLMTIQ